MNGGAAPIRVLVLSDTHLGLDLPERPRVAVRRRGPELFARVREALAPARAGAVDLVVHGGDLFFRSRVRIGVAQAAFALFIEVADGGVPVVIVPGNHERSAIPYPLLLAHANVHLLDRPRTLSLRIAGQEVAVAGFPFARRARAEFPALLDATGWRAVPAAARLLVIHQAVEGSRVGPIGYTFTDGDDVVRTADIPRGFAAVVSGHIHRAQVLRASLGGAPLPCPVIHPGSIDRISFAEARERKGFTRLDLAAGGDGGSIAALTFCEMPARPMATVEIDATGLATEGVLARFREAAARLPADTIVRLRLGGVFSDAVVPPASRLRAAMAPGMSLWGGPAGPERSADGRHGYHRPVQETR